MYARDLILVVTQFSERSVAEMYHFENDDAVGDVRRYFLNIKYQILRVLLPSFPPRMENYRCDLRTLSANGIGVLMRPHG